MKKTTLTLLALAIGATALTGCGKSYDQTVKDCHIALAKQHEDDPGKPDECTDVTEDDYSAIVVHVAMGRAGWLDEDGRFDENKMLQDVAETP